jgi:PilZ domain-containing protein
MTRTDTEKRRAPRRRVLKGGKISFRQLGTSTDCTIRNLSDTGACLLVASPVGIPNDFDLLPDGGGATMRCRVEWRSGNKIGVSFPDQDR